MKTIRFRALALACAASIPIVATPAVAGGGDDKKFSHDQEAGYLGQTSLDALVQSKFKALKDRREMRRTRDTADRVVAWHEAALDAVALDHTPNNVGVAPLNNGGPVRTARALAIVHIAMFDALNAFSGKFRAYDTIADAPQGASKDAAIAYAAYGALVALYPAQATQLNLLLSSDVSQINASAVAIAAGKIVGQAAAAAILANRTNDGSQIGEVNYGAGGLLDGDTLTFYGNPINGPSSAAPNWSPDPLTPGATPGTTLQLALGAQWGKLKPFVLTTGKQFRAPPPPMPNSAEYTAGYNEVKAIGASSPGNTATARTRFIGNFWGYDGAPLLGTPPRLYNQIALQIALDNGLRGPLRIARYLAMVNAGMADAGIAAWDSKYFYNYWRPVTGIPRGAEDGNPNTAADPNWRPVGISVINTSAPILATPPFPAYVSGHATFGATMFEIARKFMPNNTPFTFVSDEYNGVGVDPFGTARPLVPVRYRSLQQAQEENGQSRVYNGVHWQWDNIQGQAIGEKVANYLVTHAFQRVRGSDADANDDD